MHHGRFWVVSKGRGANISKTWLYAHVHLSITHNNQGTCTRAEHACGSMGDTRGMRLSDSSQREEGRHFVAPLSWGIGKAKLTETESSMGTACRSGESGGVAFTQTKPMRFQGRHYLLKLHPSANFISTMND